MRGPIRTWVATTEAPCRAQADRNVGSANPLMSLPMQAPADSAASTTDPRKVSTEMGRSKLVQCGYRRHDAVDLLGGGDLGSGGCTDPADVEDVGSVGDVLFGQAQEVVKVPVATLVEERVGGAVEDGHHDRPVGDVDDVFGAQLQDHVGDGTRHG